MIFNRRNNGAEELRMVTCSFYANADFTKIASMVATVQTEVAKIVGADVMGAIEAAYEQGEDSEIIRAAQATIGYMATMRYFRLNDISHETDGRKVKMDGENERRPFEWQLERDDRMHLEEYYNSFDRFIGLLMADTNFQQTQLYQRMNGLVVKDCETLQWVTGIEFSNHLLIRILPLLNEAQMYVQKAYGEAPLSGIDDEGLLFLVQSAIGHRAMALFVRRTEMKALPAGAFREVIMSGGGKKDNTTEQLHDYYREEMQTAEGYVHDMQSLRDYRANENVAHLTMPENDENNKYFRV